MKQLTLIVILVIIWALSSCTEVSNHTTASVVRAHVIDSLKNVYEDLKEVEPIKVEVRQATVTAPKPEPTQESTVTNTDDTYTAKDGTVYQVHTGKKGGRYIIRTSKTTGKEYKSYIK